MHPIAARLVSALFGLQSSFKIVFTIFELLEQDTPKQTFHSVSQLQIIQRLDSIRKDSYFTSQRSSAGKPWG